MCCNEQYLEKNTIESLKHNYVAYALLKKQLMRAVDSKEVRDGYPWEPKVHRPAHWWRSDNVSVEERLFLQLLERELERVDNFVVSQLAELRNTLHIIERDTQQANDDVDADELEREIDGAASSLVALDSFVLVNYNALRRIVGLHDALTGEALSTLFAVRLGQTRFTSVKFDGAYL